MNGETIRVPVIRATPADTATLSDVIAAAFHDLAPSRWLIADPAARRDVFPAYFRLYVEHALADGLVHTTPARDAVALWLPAGPGAPGDPPGYSERLAAATAPWTARFVVFDKALEARHPETAHEHLAILAVLPGRQSHGTGTTLLRARHQDLDDTATSAYLEASSPRARELYLRHGYTDHGAPVQLPGSGPAMWPMVRQPFPTGHVGAAASSARDHSGG
jgi:GNAT superfamily N-acetyltransferase